MTAPGRRRTSLPDVIALQALTIADARRIGNRLFAWTSAFCLGLAVVSATLIPDRTVGGLSAAFALSLALLNRARSFRRLPAALLVSFNLTLFLAFPICYIGVRGSDYDFAGRFAAPGGNDSYLNAVAPAIAWLSAYLLLLLAGMWLGHAVTASLRRSPNTLTWRPSPTALGLVGVFVAYVAIADSARLFAAISGSTAKVQALLPFLFLDHSYLLMFPFLLYGRLAAPGHLREHRRPVVFALVLLMFAGVFVAATSKGAILTLAVYLFLFPVSHFYRARGFVYWPSRLLVALALLAALPMFFLTQAARQARMQGTELQFEDLARRISSEVGDTYGPVITTVADRISAGFHNYVMIYSRFGESRDAAYARDFREYLGKSFVNLVWMGTPFPEAYLPSSQLLPTVLEKTPLLGYGDAASFWAQANTQPYTAFGAALVLFGLLGTALVCFAAGVLLASAYNLAGHLLLVRLWLLYSVNAFFQIYGVETTVQTSIHFIVAAAFMVGLLQISRCRLRPGQPLPAAAARV